MIMSRCHLWKCDRWSRSHQWSIRNHLRAATGVLGDSQRANRDGRHLLEMVCRNLDHNICEGCVHFIWSSRKECYQIIHNDVQSQAIVQLLLSDERYNSHSMFLCYSAVRNYSIARGVDGGPVSASAQRELHGINRPHSKVLLYTKLCLLLGGTASRGASQSVVCPEGKEGIAAEQVTWNQTPQGWLWIVPLMLWQLKYSNVPGHALLQDWPAQLRWMLISVTLRTDEVVLRQWRVGEKTVLKASQKCATWPARTFLGFCLKL